MRQETTRYAKRICAALCVACVILCAFIAFAQPAFAEPTKGVDRVVDPSTADGNGTILGEGVTNTLNSGRIWADKSVYTEDAEVDGATVSNDGDFLVVFSALGSSTVRKGTGYDGVPPSPIAGEDGSLTYSDPLGDYMEPVGDVTLVQFGQSYTYASTASSATSIAYKPTVDRSIVNKSYEDGKHSFKLSDISIEARRDNATKRWIMNVSVPSRALPLYLSILDFGTQTGTGSETLKSFATNAGQASSLPLRIAYSVGISKSVKSADGSIDLTKISTEYQESHLVQTPSGTGVSFHSNRYDDPTAIISPDGTYGNAAVTVTPASDNAFYRFQDNLIVYRNGRTGTYNGDPAISGNVSNPVMSLYEIQSDPQGLFYIARSYYRRSGTGGLHSAYEVLSYKGSELSSAVCYYDTSLGRPVSSTGANTVVATKVGSPCIGNVARFRTKKATNPTDTASYSYYGSFLADPQSPDTYAVEAHYGNNGLLTVSFLPSDALQISGEKRFQVNGSVWAPTAADYGSLRFLFLPNRSNPAGDPVAVGGIIASSDEHGSIRFDIGSYVQPGVYAYDIRELFPNETIPGLSYDSTTYVLRVEARAGSNGRIELATTIVRNGITLPAGQTIAFTNSYDTASVSASLSGQVQLAGMALESGMFEFLLEAVSAIGASGVIPSPLPSNSSALNGQGGLLAFGDIVFTQAGQYVYRILQGMPESGFSASDFTLDASKYLVTFTVRHSATGPLYITMTMQKEGQPGAVDDIVFLNRVKTPELVVEKTQIISGNANGSANDVVSGDVITYRITLRNPSSIAVHDVLLYDKVPDGLILASDFGAHAEGPYLHEGRLYWIIRQLAGGESVTCEFTVNVPEAAPSTIWTNIASASYPDLVDADTVRTVDSPALLTYYASPRDPEPTPSVTPEPSVPSNPSPSTPSAVTPVVDPAGASAVGRPADATVTIPEVVGAVRTDDDALHWRMLLIFAMAAALASLLCAILRRRKA